VFLNRNQLKSFYFFSAREKPVSQTNFQESETQQEKNTSYKKLKYKLFLKKLDPSRPCYCFVEIGPTQELYILEVN